MFTMQRGADGPTSTFANMLPDPNMALWPGLKQISGLIYVEKVFGRICNFIIPKIEEHKRPRNKCVLKIHRHA